MSDFNNQHPITPPLKLFREWTEYRGTECVDQFWWRIATQAARWGADQELEALLDLADHLLPAETLRYLLETRRPKPPSLKELALTQLDSLHADLKMHGLGTNTDTIRRALEQLDV